MRPVRTKLGLNRQVALWLGVGLAGFFLLPWYTTSDPFWSFEWLVEDWPLDDDAAPAILQAMLHGKAWLYPVPVFFALALPALVAGAAPRRASTALIAAGAGGLAYLLLQGFSIGIAGYLSSSLIRYIGVTSMPWRRLF